MEMLSKNNEKRTDNWNFCKFKKETLKVLPTFSLFRRKPVRFRSMSCCSEAFGQSVRFYTEDDSVCKTGWICCMVLGALD